jgi:hypothetical protein
MKIIPLIGDEPSRVLLTAMDVGTKDEPGVGFFSESVFQAARAR